MKQIGIMSDTHGYFNPALKDFFKDCDEIWHAGDWGDPNLVQTIEKMKPIRGVYGNIDGQEIRQIFPEVNFFEVEGVHVCMTHIGGYPGHYSTFFKKIMHQKPIDLMVCGHSHILRVMRDETNKWLHINPGACGNHGFQKVNTAIRIKFENKRMFDLEVWEQKRN